MDLHLKDKVVIVTGGASGIGAAISLTLAQEGAVPVIFGKSPMPEDFAQALQATAARHLFVQLELSDDAACGAAVGQVVAQLGRVDGLVNNAAIASGGTSCSPRIEPAVGRVQDWMQAQRPRQPRRQGTEGLRAALHTDRDANDRV